MWYLRYALKAGMTPLSPARSWTFRSAASTPSSARSLAKAKADVSSRPARSGGSALVTPVR